LSTLRFSRRPSSLSTPLDLTTLVHLTLRYLLTLGCGPSSRCRPSVCVPFYLLNSACLPSHFLLRLCFFFLLPVCLLGRISVRLVLSPPLFPPYCFVSFPRFRAVFCLIQSCIGCLFFFRCPPHPNTRADGVFLSPSPIQTPCIPSSSPFLPLPFSTFPTSLFSFCTFPSLSDPLPPRRALRCFQTSGLFPMSSPFSPPSRNHEASFVPLRLFLSSGNSED